MIRVLAALGVVGAIVQTCPAEETYYIHVADLPAVPYALSPAGDSLLAYGASSEGTTCYWFNQEGDLQETFLGARMAEWTPEGRIQLWSAITSSSVTGPGERPRVRLDLRTLTTSRGGAWSVQGSTPIEVSGSISILPPPNGNLSDATGLGDVVFQDSEGRRLEPETPLATMENSNVGY